MVWTPGARHPAEPGQYETDDPGHGSSADDGNSRDDEVRSEAGHQRLQNDADRRPLESIVRMTGEPPRFFPPFFFEPRFFFAIRRLLRWKRGASSPPVSEVVRESGKGMRR